MKKILSQQIKLVSLGIFFYTSFYLNQAYSSGDLIHHDISTQDITQEITSRPTQDRRWHLGLSRQIDQQLLGGQIVAYKIRWFNGKWSGWYIPGVNDIDHKFNTGGADHRIKQNTMRRMWSYFCDHEHKYIIIKPKLQQ